MITQANKIESIAHHPEFFGYPYRFSITFNDFENIILKFSGMTHDNVRTWFERLKNVTFSFQIPEQ